jgi:hypothetical protein
VTTIDSNDVTVNISGLPRYETITDNLDHQRFRGGGDITLSAAQVNSGLTLHSYYRGTDHPVATLTLTAMDGTGAPSDAQTITVTDPAPATGTTTSSAGQGSGSWGQHHHGWWSRQDSVTSGVAISAPSLTAPNPSATGSNSSLADQSFALLNQHLAGNCGRVDPGQIVAAVSNGGNWGQDSILTAARH